jgi:hypothetical protein
MDLSLPLIVEWPNGSRLPIRVSRTAMGEDLLTLLSFCCRNDQQVKLVFEGCCIHPGRQLCQQRIQPHSTIRVIQLSDDPADTGSDDDQFDAICPELFRIADVQFSLVEGHKKAGHIYRTMLIDQSDSDESDSSDSVLTVIPERAQDVSNDPLPTLDVSSDSDEEECGRGDPFRSDECGGLFRPRSERANWNW